MESLSVGARRYIGVVILLGTVAALWAGRTITPTWEAAPLALVLLPLMVVFEFFMIRLPRGVNVSLATVLRLASVILLGPAYTVLLTVVSFLIADGLLRKMQKAWYKVAFNAGMHATASAIAGLSYVALADADPILANSFYDILAMAVAGFLYVALNSAMISVVVALADDLPLGYVWARNQQTVLPQYLAMLPMGVAFALLWQSYPWSVALFLMPMAIVHHSFKARMDLEQQTEQALYAMADILDRRDHLTSRHSEMVAEWAGKIARQLQLPQDQVETIMASARLHDLGKIGINDAILKKAGPLSSEERKDMERHTEIGAQILGYFPLFSKGVAYLLHHHERYDGQGYPSGLKQDEIPLGARIIQVADAYEAMTARRYYRSPLPREHALDNLRAESGRQFDPMVVGALLKVLAADEEEIVVEGKVRRLRATQ